MATPDRKRWIRAVVLLAVLYFIFGVVFAELAGSAASNSMRVNWNRLGFVFSAIAFAIHIGYEQFRLRNPTLITAWHVSLAVALGGFALAVKANVHGYAVATTNRRALAFALIAWPLVTGVPAFLVALIAAAGLAFKRRSNQR
jgi:hypothetical protein